jgi:hypothetical protein
MRTVIRASLFISLLLVAGTAYADWVTSSTASCRSSGTGFIGRYSPFLRNVDYTLAAHVVCPLSLNSTLTPSVDVNEIIVRYKDASPTDPFYCWTARTSSDGTTTSGSTKYTCSTGGGCDSYTVTETGQGNHLSLDLPVGQIGIDDSYTVHCIIPKLFVGEESGLYVYYAQ